MKPRCCKTNKQLSRILTAVATLFVVTATACYSGSYHTKFSNPKPRSENSPHSVLEGRTVRIQPYNATFDLPESWVGPTYGKNLFLSGTELMSISEPTSGQHIYYESEVMNSVVLFSNCAVHAGEKGWNESVSDQVRVYIVSLTSEEVGTRIEHDGLRTAGRVFDKATYTAGNFGEWSHSTLHYFNAPTHALLYRDIDFYFRSFGEKTVIFVFLHSVGNHKHLSIISSFKWQPKN